MIVVTATDDRYVPGVLALIYSTWVHNESVEFYVLDNGISEDNKQKISVLSDIINSTITLIDISKSGISDIKLPNKRLTVSAYGRLLIPDLFEDHEKVLYLDCDMLVTGSLAELSQIDLGNAVAGVIHDYGPGKVELSQVGISADKYFNSGLILFNIAKWRDARITESCFAQASKALYLYHDQSVLNIVCQDRIRYLPPEYNIFVDVPAERRREVKVKEIKVLHYVGPDKPWLVAQTDPKEAATIYADIWNNHIDALREFIEFPDPSRRHAGKSFGEIFAYYLSYANRRRKAWMGRLVGKEKYIRRADAIEFVNVLLPEIQNRLIETLRQSELAKRDRQSASLLVEEPAPRTGTAG